MRMPSHLVSSRLNSFCFISTPLSVIPRPSRFPNQQISLPSPPEAVFRLCLSRPGGESWRQHFDFLPTSHQRRVSRTISGAKQNVPVRDFILRSFLNDSSSFFSSCFRDFSSRLRSFSAARYVARSLLYAWTSGSCWTEKPETDMVAVEALDVPVCPSRGTVDDRAGNKRWRAVVCSG